VEVDFSIFYNSLIAVGLIIVVGFFAGKRSLIDDRAVRGLVNLLLTIAWPAALLGSFPGQFNVELLRTFLYGLGGGVLVLGLAILVSRLLFPRKRFADNYFEYQFAFIFNNASFLGFPLVSSIYGQPGLVPYAGFIVVFNLALFGYGAMLFKEKFSWRDTALTFLNPNVIAVFLGLFFFLVSFELPTPVGRAVGYVGAMMTPMSLIVIGYMLSRVKLRQVFRRKAVVVTCLAQLTLGPAITFLVLKLIGAPSDVLRILVLIQALPTATSLGLFAEKYRGDRQTASAAGELVAISTVMSAVTLPLVLLAMAELLA